MSIHQSISSIENLVVYLGQIPVQYNQARGKYLQIKYPFWTLLKIGIFYIILLLIFLVKKNQLIVYTKTKNFDTIQTFTIYFVKFYRIFHDIIQLIEMKWNQKKFEKTMNKLIVLSNNIKSSYENNNEKKVKNYIVTALFGLFLMEVVVVWLLTWSLNFETGLYSWLSTAYYNGHIVIEFIQCLYFICVFKILSGKLNSIVDFVEANPVENLNICINYHRNSRKIIRKMMDVQACQTILHLFSLILIFGCSLYVGFASVLNDYGNRLKFSLYMLASTSVLVMTPVLCFNISDIQDQVKLLLRI